MMGSQDAKDDTLAETVKDQQHTGNHEPSQLDKIGGTRAGAENVEGRTTKAPVAPVKK